MIKKIRQITYTWILTGIVGWTFCFFDNSSSYEWFHFCREPLISFSKPRKGRRSGLQNFLEFVTFFPCFWPFFREKKVWRPMAKSFLQFRNHRKSNCRIEKRHCLNLSLGLIWIKNQLLFSKIACFGDDFTS